MARLKVKKQIDTGTLNEEVENVIISSRSNQSKLQELVQNMKCVKKKNFFKEVLRS